MRKGIVPAIAALVILAGVIGGGIGIPVAVDKIAGKDIGPDNPIYGVERAGEAIQKAFAFSPEAKASFDLQS